MRTNIRTAQRMATAPETPLFRGAATSARTPRRLRPAERIGSRLIDRSIRLLEGPVQQEEQTIMISIRSERLNSRPTRHEAATHCYSLGQSVRLKRSFNTIQESREIYQITARLPPRGDSLQYRIRSEAERHERMATEDSLEPVRASRDDEDAALLKRTFGNGQRTKA
ncbi:hypothetical protein [Mesorhizobium dulcispinae]